MLGVIKKAMKEVQHEAAHQNGLTGEHRAAINNRKIETS